MQQNIVLNLIVFISMGSVSQRGNEKICEKIVACPFEDLPQGPPPPPPPKKKKKKDNFKKIFFKKLNLKNQSGKVIWFTKIDGLQGLLGLNLFVKA
jgi:hypothetical protein